MSNLSPATEYDWRLRARNTQGWGEWSNWASQTTAAVPPDTPGAPTFDQVTGVSIRVNWTAPNDNGAAIDYYDVEFGKVGESATQAVPSTPRMRVFGGLDAAQEYRFRVRAHNDGGWSGWGPWANQSTTSRAPDAPAGLNFTGVGRTRYTLNWTEPDDNGSAILQYEILHRVQGSGSQWAQRFVGSSNLSSQYTGRQASTTYEMEMRAENARGWGDWSSLVAVTTTAIDPPNRPSAPTATDLSANGFTANWTAPGNNGTAITKYEYQATAVGFNFEIARTETTATTAQIPYANLSDTMTANVDVRVRAYNGAWSDWSPNRRVVIPVANVPDKPDPPTAVPTPGSETTSLTVTWDEPAANGPSVGDYDLRYRVKDQPATDQGVGQGGARTNTVGSLQPGTTYQFTVRGQNTIGESDWSDFGEGTTWPATAAAPTVTGDSPNSLAVSWSAAAGADSYDLRYRAGTSGSWTNPTGLSSDTMETITGLLPNTSYEVQVRSRKGSVGGAWSPTGTGSTQTASIAWSGSFHESGGNDGTVSGSVTGTLTGDTFTTGDFFGAVTVSNVPGGLTAQVARNNSTMLTLTLTGTADSHAASDSITNLTITVGDDAYTNSNATSVTNSTKNDIAVTYIDQAQNPPSAPTNLSFTFISTTEFEFTWTAPPTDSSRAPVTGYELQIQFADQTWLQVAIFAAGATSGRGTINNPIRMESIPYRLVATSSAGPSAASNVVTVQDITPTAPTAVTVAPTSGSETTSLDVSWTAPDFDGTPVTDYDVRYRAGTSGDWTSRNDTGSNASDTSTSAAIAGLAPGTAYQVQVRAGNARGNGGWSGSATGTTRLAAPGAPTVTGESGTSLAVSWTAVPGADSYDWRYREGTSGNWTNDPGITTETTRTITGLMRNTAYQVQVAARRGPVGGPWSTAGSGSTLAQTGSIAWSTGGFTESSDNDGTVTGSITATLTGGTFNSNVATLSQSISVSNLPSGLTRRTEVNTALTVVTFTLTGTADSHLDADDVSNLSFEFGDNAFTGGDADDVANVTSPNIAIDFNNPTPTASIAWSGGFRETDANDGSVTGSVTLDGEVASAMIGVDRTGLNLTLGLMVSHSHGEGEYRKGSGDTATSGDVESTLTGLYPYGRFEASDRLSLWGVAGYGEGTLTLTPDRQDGESGTRYEADMDLAMAAVGARAVVVEPGAEGGLELAVKPDAMAVRTTSERVETATGVMEAADTDVTRLRLGVEGTWRGEGNLVPTAEVALRHDGGDAETGLGVEVGGGLAFSDPSSGLTAKLTGRALVAHADDDYREWGVGGSLVLDPGAQGRGLSFALRPAWGADASAAERLLGGDPLANLAANDDDSDEARGRLDAELGYGLPAFGGLFTGTPHAGFTLGATARELRLGWRLAPATRKGLDFDLGLEATRREAANDDGEAEHGIELKLNAQF